MASVLEVPSDALMQAWLDTSHDRNIGCFGSLEADVKEICSRIGCNPTPHQVDEAIRIRLEITRRNLQPRTDAVSTINALKTAGMKVALLSDAPFDCPTLWDQTEFASLMDVTIFSCQMGFRKPDPRMYSKVCETLNVLPERCLFVGDGGSHELTGARDFGIYPVLIRVGYDSHLDEWRPDAVNWNGEVVSSLTEVIDVCGI
jgi:putative hydrolase of the HAD superfamily